MCEAVVRWFEAVQSQEYSRGKWSVAQRTTTLRDADIAAAAPAGVALRRLRAPRLPLLLACGIGMARALFLFAALAGVIAPYKPKRALPVRSSGT